MKQTFTILALLVTLYASSQTLTATDLLKMNQGQLSKEFLKSKNFTAWANNDAKSIDGKSFDGKEWFSFDARFLTYTFKGTISNPLISQFIKLGFKLIENQDNYRLYHNGKIYVEHFFSPERKGIQQMDVVVRNSMKKQVIK